MATQPIGRVPRVLVATVGAFIVLVGLAPLSHAANEAILGCGDTLTVSVHLTSDLLGCGATGLVVGAGGITVDLNGHTVGGTNAPNSVGILNNGYSNVKIVHGTILGFHTDGVAIHNGRRNTVSRLTVRGIGSGGKENDADAGILVDHSPGAVVADTVVKNNVHAFQADGVDVLFSAATQVLQSTLSQNQWNGLVVIKSPRSRVVGNQLDANGNNGMEANVGSDSILVSGNRADQNRNWGLVVGALRSARVLGNTVTRNGQDGLSFFDLAGSTIQGNHATENAIGINLHGGQHGSKFNQVLGNTVTRNKHAGILVSGDNAKSPADANLLAGNMASRNGSDGGILVDGPARGNKLRNNTATGNAGHGISAVRGTIDGGGNRAHGNRAAPQCLGVLCT
jgi:parallel beta-helix repeat protein